MKILLTGATGYIGSNLLGDLSAKHDVLAIVRGERELDARVVRGDFWSEAAFGAIDGTFDALVHLAAVTGGCNEEDGLAVNVVGTQRLLRFAAERGCRRFVLASSVAATGCLAEDFIPQELPIPDIHPCLARDAYGLSKALMEEVARYFARVTPGTAFACLRLGWVLPPSPPAIPDTTDSVVQPVIELAAVRIEDVRRALTLALEVPLPTGCHVLNIVGPDSRTNVPVVDVLRAKLGPELGMLDLGYFQRPENAFAPIFAAAAAQRLLQFAATRSVRCDRAQGPADTRLAESIPC